MEKVICTGASFLKGLIVYSYLSSSKVHFQQSTLSTYLLVIFSIVLCLFQHSVFFISNAENIKDTSRNEDGIFVENYTLSAICQNFTNHLVSSNSCPFFRVKLHRHMNCFISSFLILFLNIFVQRIFIGEEGC